MSNSSVDGHTGAVPSSAIKTKPAVAGRFIRLIKPGQRGLEVRRSPNCMGKSHGARGSRCSMAFSYQPAAESTSARTDIRKNRVITKKATRTSKLRAFAELFEQGLRAALFSDALKHSGDPADHRRIPGSQRSCLFFVSDGFGHPILL